MNIIAEEILIDKFDFAIGTSRIENRMRSGETLPPDHVRAYRMCKEEIIYSWLDLIRMIIRNYFVMTGVPVGDKELFETEFPPQLNMNMRNAVKNLSNMPLWKNTEVSIFGGKQAGDYWKKVFSTGKTPDGAVVIATPINLIDLIK